MKDIKNYEGLYAVTEDGRVWSYRSNKFMTPAQNNGYLFVNLYKEHKLKKAYIHRLVAEAYLPNPNNYLEVNHVDENKDNNALSNLEWCTRQYNNSYGTRNERISKALGKSVLCVELDRVFRSVTEAAKQLNINRSNIFRAIRGDREKAYGYHWRYVNE